MSKTKKTGIAGTEDPLEDFQRLDALSRLANSPYRKTASLSSPSSSSSSSSSSNKQSSSSLVSRNSYSPVSRASSNRSNARPQSSSTQKSTARSNKSPPTNNSSNMSPRERMVILEREMQEAQANKNWQGSTQICIELLALAQLAYGAEALIDNSDKMMTDYYQLARAQWNLANCYLQQKLVPQAVEHATRAADILALSESPEEKIQKGEKGGKGKKKTGFMHKDRRSLQAAVLITLAIGYTLGRKYRDAHSALALALEVGPEPVPIYKAIAKVYLAQKKEDEALEALETALQLQITYGAQDDVQIAEISREMGRLSLAKGDAETSLKHYSRAYTHYSKVAPNSFEAAECGLQIGAAKAKSGDYKAAEPLLKAAQEAYDTHKGPHHLSTLSVVRERALLLVHDKRYKEALYCLQSLASRQAKALGPKTIKLADTTKLMGTVHLALGDLKGALFMYSEAAQKFEKKYGKKHKKVKELRSTIKKIRTQIGDKDENETESESESEEESEESEQKEDEDWQEKDKEQEEEEGEGEEVKWRSSDSEENEFESSGRNEENESEERNAGDGEEYATDDFEEDET